MLGIVGMVLARDALVRGGSCASVVNLRVSGERHSAAGGICSLADEARGNSALAGMLATIEGNGRMLKPA